jgi:hypothetical protein
MAKEKKNGNHLVKDPKTLVENPFTGRLVNPKYLEKVLKKKKILQESVRLQNTKKVPLRNSANANKLNYRGGVLFGFFESEKAAWQKDKSIHASLVVINNKLITETTYLSDQNLINEISTLMLLFNKNLNWYVSNKINDYDSINKKDVMIDVSDINRAIDFFTRLKIDLDIIKTKTAKYIIGNNRIIINLIRTNYSDYQIISYDDTRSTITIELYDFLKEELRKELNGSPGKNKGTTALKAVDNIDTELNNNIILKNLLECYDLLKTYIATLETFKKVGGSKMKALKLPNTPKKAIPKNTSSRK